MPSRDDVAGNDYMNAMRRQALAVLAYWTTKMEDFDNMGIQVLELRVQSPGKTGGDYRVIAKARSEAGDLLVAFGNGADVQSSLADLKSRAEMTGIKWREDKPWEPQSS